MKIKKTALCFFILMCLIGLFFTPVFVMSAVKDQNDGNLELFELIARIIGYLLIIAIELFTAMSAIYIYLSKQWDKCVKAATTVSLITVITLLIHDIILFTVYGNQLEGTFTMMCFFVLDLMLLLLYCVVTALWRKKEKTLPCVYSLFGIAAVWLLYMIADMAGYPASQITDWDEPMMKFVPMCNVLFLGIIKLMQYNKSNSIKGK